MQVQIGMKLFSVLQLDDEWLIDELTVTDVGERFFYVSQFSPPSDDVGLYIPYDELGVTVFFSREDAEKALEGRRLP